MARSRNNAAVAVGLLIGAGALWLACRNMDLGAMLQAFRRVHWINVVCAGGFFLTSVFLRSLLWREILLSARPVGVGAAFRSVLIGNMGNILFPARLGDLLRVYVLKKGIDVSAAVALSALLVEKALDVLFLFVLTGGLVFLLGPAVFFDGHSRTGFSWEMALIVIAGAGTGVLLFRRVTAHPFVQRQCERLQLTLFWPKMRSAVQDLGRGMSAGRLVKIVSLGAMLWLCTFIYVLALTRSFSLEVPWQAALFILVALQFTFILPATPGYIGIYQFVCVSVLGVWGINNSVALGFSFVLQAVDFVPSIMIGLFLAVRMNIMVPRLEDQLLKEAA